MVNATNCKVCFNCEVELPSSSFSCLFVLHLNLLPGPPAPSGQKQQPQLLQQLDFRIELHEGVGQVCCPPPAPSPGVGTASPGRWAPAGLQETPPQGKELERECPLIFTLSASMLLESVMARLTCPCALRAAEPPGAAGGSQRPVLGTPALRGPSHRSGLRACLSLLSCSLLHITEDVVSVSHGGLPVLMFAGEELMSLRSSEPLGWGLMLGIIHIRTSENRLISPFVSLALLAGLLELYTAMYVFSTLIKYYRTSTCR